MEMGTQRKIKAGDGRSFGCAIAASKSVHFVPGSFIVLTLKTVSLFF